MHLRLGVSVNQSGKGFLADHPQELAIGADPGRRLRHRERDELLVADLGARPQPRE